ncbi:YraN family protein, partial [Candidatus Saccharibacteria bacterium]|nr:YraN family protein [Candidatus Saccharibacteria bacterium]
MGSLRRRAARIGSAPATAGGATGAHSVTSSATGAKGEAVVADYLARRGHKILARNHKTKFYEIDIVSATKDHIYFTEVKYRKDKSHGQPVDFIDAKKQQQMAFAATAFMKYLAKKLDRKIDDLPSPILAAAAVEGADFKLTKWFEITR